MLTYDFDETSIDSILAQANKVLHKSLRQVLSPEQIQEIEATANSKQKGKFGELVEKYVFDKEQDNLSRPDFPDAPLELKTTPIKALKKKGFSAKERLVLNIIDFISIVEENWESSTFLKKNNNLLIMFYLYIKGTLPLDQKFKLIEFISLLKLPTNDLETIKRDWAFIVNKIRDGKAHLLSEGDTYYLGACTKGAKTMTNYCKQPFSSEPAQRRAFSLKQRYLSFIISANQEKLRSEYVSILPERSSESIEAIVSRRLSPYLGLTVKDIHNKLRSDLNTRAKGYSAALALEMLGSKKRKIAEFEKAEISIKTIRLRASGMPKEHMSFPAMSFLEVAKETWENSTILETLSTRKYLFLIYQFDKSRTLRFKKYMFWNMPYEDIVSHAKKVWATTQELIQNDVPNDEFPGIADDPVCHVRPHGQKKIDTAPLPSGRKVTKQSFWLNAGYLKKQISLVP